MKLTSGTIIGALRNDDPIVEYQLSGQTFAQKALGVVLQSPNTFSPRPPGPVLGG